MPAAVASPGARCAARGGSAAKHASKYGVRWESDAGSTYCRLCGGKWGLLRRRHHCRACGQLVCDECSRTRLQLAGSDNLKRACDVCAAARRDATEQERRGAGTAVADPRELL